MKIVIYYFSGTGNSLKIAKDLSNKLEGCELVPIAKLWEHDIIIPRSEKIGLIFPLYAMGCPSIIRVQPLWGGKRGCLYLTYLGTESQPASPHPLHCSRIGV